MDFSTLISNLEHAVLISMDPYDCLMELERPTEKKVKGVKMTNQQIMKEEKSKMMNVNMRGSCEFCKKGDVCKYADDTKKVMESINKFIHGDDCRDRRHLTADIKCQYYEAKNSTHPKSTI